MLLRCRAPPAAGRSVLRSRQLLVMLLPQVTSCRRATAGEAQGVYGAAPGEVARPIFSPNGAEMVEKNAKNMLRPPQPPKAYGAQLGVTPACRDAIPLGR